MPQIVTLLGGPNHGSCELPGPPGADLLHFGIDEQSAAVYELIDATHLIFQFVGVERTTIEKVIETAKENNWDLFGVKNLAYQGEQQAGPFDGEATAD